MAHEPAGQPALRADLRVIDFADEALVVDEVRGAVHHVDGIGALVLGWLDGNTSVRDLAGDVTDVFNVDAATVARQLASFVERLDLHGLLSTSECQPMAAPTTPEYLADPPSP